MGVSCSNYHGRNLPINIAEPGTSAPENTRTRSGKNQISEKF
jgi:hypothetical protein